MKTTPQPNSLASEESKTTYDITQWPKKTKL